MLDFFHGLDTIEKTCISVLMCTWFERIYWPRDWKNDGICHLITFKNQVSTFIFAYVFTFQPCSVCSINLNGDQNWKTPNTNQLVNVAHRQWQESQCDRTLKNVTRYSSKEVIFCQLMVMTGKRLLSFMQNTSLMNKAWDQRYQVNASWWCKASGKKSCSRVQQ
jgi:hypothetical protein